MLDSITSAVILFLSPILFGVMSLFQSSPPATETTKVPDSSRIQMSPSGEPAYAVSVHDDDLEDRELLTRTIYEPTTDSAIISTKSYNDLTKLERREQFLRSRLKIHEHDHEVLDNGVLHSIEAQNGFIEHIRINNSGAPIRIARGVDLDNALPGNVEYYTLYRPGQIMYNDKPAISGTEISGRQLWTQEKIDHLKEEQRSRVVKKSPKQVLDESQDQMENDIQADNIVQNHEPLPTIDQYLDKDSTFSTDFFRKGFEDGSIKRIKDSAGKDILEWTKIETPYESAQDGDVKNLIYHIYDTYWKLEETIRWTNLKEEQRSRVVKKSPKQVLDESQDQMENDIQADNIVQNHEPLPTIDQYLDKDSTFSTDFFRKGFEDGSIKRIKDSAGKDILEWTKIETPYESAQDGDVKNLIYHIYDTYWKLEETIRWTKDNFRTRRDVEQVEDSGSDVNDNQSDIQDVEQVEDSGSDVNSDIQDDFVAFRSTMNEGYTEDDITFPKHDNQDSGIHMNGYYYLPPIIPATFDSNTDTIITPARFAVIDQMVSDDSDLSQEESEHDQIIDNQLPIMGIPGKDAKVGDVVYKILYRPGEKMKDGKIATGDEAKYTHYWEQEDIDLELQDLEDLQAESMQSDDAIESKPLSNMNTGLHSIQRDSNIRLGIRATEAKRGDVSYETLYRSGETMDNGQIALGGETKQVVLWTTRDIEWTKNAIEKSQAQNNRSVAIIPSNDNESEIRIIQGVPVEYAKPGDVRYYALYNHDKLISDGDVPNGPVARMPILWEVDTIQQELMNQDEMDTNTEVNISKIQIINPFIKEVNDIEKHTIIDTPTNEILETRYWTPRQYEYNASAHYEKLVKTNSPYTDARISVISDQNGNTLRRIKGLDPEDARPGDVQYYELYNYGEPMNNNEVATGAEIRHIEYWKDETIEQELINIRNEERLLEERNKKEEEDKIKKEKILSSSVELFKINDSKIQIMNPFTKEVLDVETHIMINKFTNQIIEVKYSTIQRDVYSIIDHYENLVKYILRYDARYADEDILLVKGTQSRIIEGISIHYAEAGDVQYYKLYNYGEDLPNGQMAIGIEIKEVVSWTDDEIARERGLSLESTQGRTTVGDMIPEDGRGINKIYTTPIQVIDPELKQIYSIVKYMITDVEGNILETIYWTPKTNQQSVIERYEDLVRSNTEYTDTRISEMEGSSISRIIQGIPLKDAEYDDVWYYELYKYGQTMRNGHIATGSEVSDIRYWSDIAIDNFKEEQKMNALLEESKSRQKEVDDSDTSTATLLKKEEDQSDLAENNEGTNLMNGNLEAEIIESMEPSQDS